VTPQNETHFTTVLFPISRGKAGRLIKARIRKWSLRRFVASKFLPDDVAKIRRTIHSKIYPGRRLRYDRGSPSPKQKEGTIR
jgi:hypothetical protein